MPAQRETEDPQEEGLIQRRPTRAPCLAWQPMLSGNRLNLFAPSPLDITIEDIAHGLSRLARWNGQTQGEWAFSVAQHSVVVAWIVAQLEPGIEARWLLAALLHDAGEYVLGDLVTPYKAAVGENYKGFETKVEEAVHRRFGLPASLPAPVSQVIKQADKASAYFEATQLAGFHEREARVICGRPPDIAVPRLESMPPNAAKALFMTRFAELQRAVLRAEESVASRDSGHSDHKQGLASADLYLKAVVNQPPP